MKFFTSDIHLGSENTIKFDMRPFKSAEDFKKYIIRQWNKQAKKEDTIYVIGDLFDCHSSESRAWENEFDFIKKIKAKIVLITGNNEDRIIKYFFNGDFDEFKSYCLSHGIVSVEKCLRMEIAGQEFNLIHKPKEHAKDCLNLFGHSHRAMGVFKSFGFNIGCDHNHFRLYDETDIAYFIDMRTKLWLDDENLKLI